MKKKASISVIIIIFCLLTSIAIGLFMIKPSDENPEIPLNSCQSPNHQLIYLGDDRVLDFNKNGDYRIWIYDRNARGEADPLTGPEVWGHWNTMEAEIGKYDETSEHTLIYLGNERILEWMWNTGEYKIWVYDRNIKGNADPLTGPEVYGTWSSIKSPDEGPDVHDVNLIYLGSNRLLEWHDNDGSWWIWVYDRTVKGNNDPLVSCEAYGKWTSITDDGNHMLYYIGELNDYSNNDVLEIDQDGKYWLWWYDQTARGETDSLSALQNKGQWNTIKSYGGSGYGSLYWQYSFVYLGNNRLLIWENSGDYRIYVIDRNAAYADDPLPGGPEVYGHWSSIN